MENYSRVMVLLGSISDRTTANIILSILREIDIPYRVVIASCHWHTDNGLEERVREIEEEIIAIVGGMQFNLPSIVETINKVNSKVYKIVLAIPTDRIAKHANEDFPAGTVVFTGGFNSISPKAGYENSALAIAKLAAFRYPEFIPRLVEFYRKMAARKGMTKNMELENGLISEPSKKS
jgi:phosphoribosylcarboxyaminoimidazole (NCAIR) mutase